MTSKLRALGGCSSHHLQGAGHIVAAPLQVAQLVVLGLLRSRMRIYSRPIRGCSQLSLCDVGV